MVELAQVGPGHATVNEEKTATMPTAVSVILPVAGFGLTVMGVKRGFELEKLVRSVR